MATAFRIPQDATQWPDHYEYLERAVSECDEASKLYEFLTEATELEALAHRANNFTLEQACFRIRARAERRLAQLLAEKEKHGVIFRHGGDRRSSSRDRNLKTRGELGIDHHVSARANKLAQIPKDKFEDLLGRGISPDAMVREHFGEKPDDPTEHFEAADIGTYEQPDASPYRSFMFHAMSPKALTDFEQWSGLTTTAKTRYVNFYGTEEA